MNWLRHIKPQKLTTQQRVRWLRLLAVTVAFTGGASASTNETAAQVRVKIPISIKQFSLSGVDYNEVHAALFVQFKNPDTSLQAESGTSSHAPRLVHVQQLNQATSSIWLRTRCGGTKKSLQFDECRGTSCTQIQSNNPDNSKKHHLQLSGEHGRYTFTADDLGLYVEGLRNVPREFCALTWPAWAVGARRLHREMALSVPTHLLFIQTSQELLWYDALNRRVWNRHAWSLTKSGIFTHAEASDEGRILLKNNNGHALYFDFKRNETFYVDGNLVQPSNFGINGVFGHDAWTGSSFNILNPEDAKEQRVALNLGGFWWQRKYLSWETLRFALALRKQPETSEWKDQLILSNASWSDASGLAKTQLVFVDGQHVRLASIEGQNGSPTTLSRLTLQRTNEALQVGKTFFAEQTLSVVDRNGSLQVIENNTERLQISAGAQGKIFQLGEELFVFQPIAPQSCKITHLRAKKVDTGWVQGIIIDSTGCTPGIGRSTFATSLVERDSHGLTIHVLPN